MTKAAAPTTAIRPPNLKTITFTLRGTSPYVQNKFSARARDEMHKKQEEGTRAKKGSAREPKNFQRCFEESQHRTSDGKCGMPANAFRNGMISACRLVGFKMTWAKQALFTEADAFDADDATPLVYFKKGTPEYTELAVRNESGVADLRARPMWKPGWEVDLRVKYDADLFSASDVYNLLMRVGMQVGIGAGRPDSKESAGMGWGLFDVVDCDNQEIIGNYMPKKKK